MNTIKRYGKNLKQSKKKITIESIDKSKISYIESAQLTLDDMNKIAYLDRYVVNSKKVAGIFSRYMFINNIASRDMNLKIDNVSNYQEYNLDN